MKNNIDDKQKNPKEVLNILEKNFLKDNKSILKTKPEIDSIKHKIGKLEKKIIKIDASSSMKYANKKRFILLKRTEL